MQVVVVVTHAADPADLHRCLLSVATSGDADRIVVVDNGGRAQPRVPGVDLLRVDNRGYGAAANAGFARARQLGATSIALLNDDVVVRRGWLDRLAGELAGDVGVVQPKLVHAGTDPLLVNSLGVAVDPSGAGTDIGDGELDAVIGDGPAHDIELFTGGAALFSTDFLDATGGFDERYFLYYEDLDLGRRGASLGWRFRCVPSSVVEHARSTSTSTIPERTRYLQERNRLWFAIGFAGRGTIVRAVWLSVRRLRHTPRTVHAKALAAGLLGTPTRIVERVRRRSDGRSLPPVSRVGESTPSSSTTRAAAPLPPVTRASERTDGVNLVGYFRRQSGISNVARAASAALRAQGVPHSIVAFDHTELPLLPDPPVLDQHLAFRDSIVFVNGDQFGLVRDSMPDVFGPGRHVAAVWFWELETLEGALAVDAAGADEIWAATTFMAGAFARLGAAPVEVVPLPFDRPAPSALGHDDFGPLRHAGDRFAFGVVLDHLSITARKNPIGAIDAFRRAFAPDEGPVLVVKTINARRCPADHRALLDAAGDRADIVIWDRHLPLADHHALMRSFDALVSLHRSEGLGLHLAEAMAMGVPVVASRFSGNLDFMDDESALLVDVELVPVGALGGWAYPPTARWAEPDLDQAAVHLRRLVDEPGLASRVGDAGRARIAAAPGPASFAATVRNRFGLTPTSGQNA